ncbi:MAG: UDP-glucuronic acid decarboxylase family protein [Hyphomicrobium sp.]
MRILISGAGGFLGSHLTDRFLSEGHTVIGVDNFCTGRRVNLAHLAHEPDFELIEHDCIEPLDIHGKLDWVLHFASPASPPKYLARPEATLRVNSEGTRHLLDLAKRKGAKFFLASTSEVYGDPAVHPQPEGYWGNVNPIGARSVYDEGKRYAEAITGCYGRAGLPVRIIRIFNTYGPRMDPADGRIVTNFITQALANEPLTLYGNGEQTRSLQYVDDLVEGITRLMRVNYSMPVNLGNREEYTVAQIAHLIRELTGSSSPFVHEPLPEDDPRQRRPDSTLARQLLDWEAKIPARVGLMRTIEHYREVGTATPLAHHAAAS